MTRCYWVGCNMLTNKNEEAYINQSRLETRSLKIGKVVRSYSFLISIFLFTETYSKIHKLKSKSSANYFDLFGLFVMSCNSKSLSLMQLSSSVGIFSRHGCSVFYVFSFFSFDLFMVIFITKKSAFNEITSP